MPGVGPGWSCRHLRGPGAVAEQQQVGVFEGGFGRFGARRGRLAGSRTDRTHPRRRLPAAARRPRPDHGGGGMTTLAQRPASLTGAATLRTLAGLEARRYALHPLFLVGVALLAAVTITNSDNLDAAAGIETLLPAFLLGLLGVFVGHQLTRSIAPSTEAVEAAPADGAIERVS